MISYFSNPSDLDVRAFAETRGLSTEEITEIILREVSSMERPNDLNHENKKLAEDHTLVAINGHMKVIVQGRGYSRTVKFLGRYREYINEKGTMHENTLSHGYCQDTIPGIIEAMRGHPDTRSVRAEIITSL